MATRDPTILRACGNRNALEIVPAYVKVITNDKGSLIVHDGEPAFRILAPDSSPLSRS